MQIIPEGGLGGILTTTRRRGRHVRSRRSAILESHAVVGRATVGGASRKRSVHIHDDFKEVSDPRRKWSTLETKHVYSQLMKAFLESYKPKRGEKKMLHRTVELNGG